MDQGNSSRFLRVFLCHSSGDKPLVRDLYRRLLLEGFKPWLDEEDLLPGQEWQSEIPKAVRAADIVLVCLSRASITKAGYVQREIKYALDVADEQPEGAIFIVPLRLEECEVPERLRRWHWVDMFNDRGYEKLIRALRQRANDLGIRIATISNALAIPSDESEFTIINVSTIIESHIYRVEELLGRSIDRIARSIGSAEDIPDGGETRKYQLHKYTLDINFDKMGFAKGIVVSGLLDENNTLEHWPLVLSRLGMTVLKQPDVVAPAARRWNDHLGYGIMVAAHKIGGMINIVRIYKIP